MSDLTTSPTQIKRRKLGKGELKKLEEGELEEEEEEELDELEEGTKLPLIYRGVSFIQDDGDEAEGAEGAEGIEGTEGAAASASKGPKGPTRGPSLVAEPPDRLTNAFLSRDLQQIPFPELINTQLTYDAMIIALNEMLRKANSNIRWSPDKAVLAEKIAKSPDYLIRTTDYFFTQVQEIRYVLYNWITRDKEKIVIVVDLANVAFAVQKKFPLYSVRQVLNEIYDMLLHIKSSRNYKRIILSVQNHYLNKPDFNVFLDALVKLVGVANLFVINAHNRASSDDLNCVLCIEILHNAYMQYIFFTGDKLQDYKLSESIARREWREGKEGSAQRERRERREQRQGKEGIAILTIPDIGDKIIDPYSMLGVRQPTRGGTKKNKKSLLNKYSRKIKHFKKVKTLHKKVKSLHKKRKTTIKAHRKYNITYKKK
jgi:hypothetical protein